jgi:ring-1,2-phenylacetyl-CoA epoxidase subunit PaaD
MVVDLTNISPKIVDALSNVFDPEIPVLSLLDMGVIKEVTTKDNWVKIKLTPTYTGCPAMDTMAADIVKALDEIGYETQIEFVLAPAWTTDWITENGRKALVQYGIATPLSEALDKSALVNGERIVPCPQCESTNTKVISEFGSTACKALFKCDDCLETFDYFKCLK